MSLCLAFKRAAAPLPFCASFANAGSMLPDSWKTRPRYLKESDWGRTCCPTCHVPGAMLLQTTTSVLEGLMVKPRAWQKLCMLSRGVWSPAGVQDSSTTSSAYTKEDTHLPEPSWTPACGAALSRWPCKPSKKIPKRVGLRGQPCNTPFCKSRGACCAASFHGERAAGVEQPDGCQHVGADPNGLQTGPQQVMLLRMAARQWQTAFWSLCHTKHCVTPSTEATDVHY